MSITVPASYFQRLYEENSDPWAFSSSCYEQEKYLATIAALPRRNFVSAFELGCSIGVLTGVLAARCGSLMSVDVAEAAITQARIRCKDQPNVHFARLQAPQEWPDGCFNLTLLSEVLYYFCAADLGRIAACVRRTRAEKGVVLLVHWTGGTDYPLGGDEAVQLFIAASGLAVSMAVRTWKYRLDLLG